MYQDLDYETEYHVLKSKADKMFIAIIILAIIAMAAISVILDKSDIKEYQDQIEQLEFDKSDLESQVEELQSEVEDLQYQIDNPEEFE